MIHIALFGSVSAPKIEKISSLESLTTYHRPVVAEFVKCFMIMCNMSQKVFRDCLEEKKSKKFPFVSEFDETFLGH